MYSNIISYSDQVSAVRCVSLFDHIGSGMAEDGIVPLSTLSGGGPVIRSTNGLAGATVLRMSALG